MKVKEISANSRCSFKQITKSGDVFYTFEFGEIWDVSDEPEQNLEPLKKQLWDTVNNQVTNQIIETKKLYQQGTN